MVHCIQDTRRIIPPPSNLNTGFPNADDQNSYISQQLNDENKYNAGIERVCSHGRQDVPYSSDSIDDDTNSLLDYMSIATNSNMTDGSSAISSTTYDDNDTSFTSMIQNNSQSSCNLEDDESTPSEHSISSGSPQISLNGDALHKSFLQL